MTNFTQIRAAPAVTTRFRNGIGSGLTTFHPCADGMVGVVITKRTGPRDAGVVGEPEHVQDDAMGQAIGSDVDQRDI